MVKYKKCPYCESKIPESAVKCRYCRSSLDKKKAAAPKAVKKKAVKKKAVKKKVVKKTAAKKTRASAMKRLPVKRIGVAKSELAKHTDIAGVFDEKYIAELKLVLLTSARTEDKIEAARKIAYSQLSTQEKTDILLRGLLDGDEKVRSEIISAMRPMGLDSDVSLALNNLSAPGTEARRTALRRLHALLPKSGRMEFHVVMVSILALIKNRPEQELIPDIIAVLDILAKAIVSSEEYLREILRLLFSVFSTAPSRVIYAAKSLMRDLYRLAPEKTLDILWEEYGKSAEDSVRMFVLTVLGELDLSGKTGAHKKVFDEIARMFVSGEEHWRLGNILVARGEDTVDNLIALYPSAADAVKTEIIRVLDRISDEGNPAKAVKKSIGEFMLDQLKSAVPQVRAVVLDAASLGDPDLPQQLRQELVLELLRRVPYQIPGAIINIEYQLSRIGLDAMLSAVEAAENTAVLPERLAIIRMLGGIAGKVAGSGKSAREKKVFTEVIAYLRRMYSKGEYDRETVAVALANACRSSACPAELVNEAGDEFMELAQGKPSVAYAVKAVSVIAASPNCELRLKRRALFLFIEKLWEKPPESISRTLETPEGTVFEITDDAQFEGIIIPAAIEGLAALCVDPTTSDDLRGHIAGQLLNKWKLVASGRVMWTPFNSSLLVKSLGIVGAEQRVEADLRLRILKSLKQYLFVYLHDSLPLIDAARTICERLDIPEAAEIAFETLEKLFAELSANKAYKDWQQEELLLSFGRLIAIGKLGRDKRDADKLRRRAVGLLYELLLDGVLGANEALSILRESDSLPKDLRDEINERLTKFFGLVAYSGQD